MRFGSVAEFLEGGAARLQAGPVALVFVEDAAEIESTIAHHLRLGFRSLVAFLPEGLSLPGRPDARVAEVRLATRAPGVVPDTVNRLIAAAPGQWFYYCFNAE